MVLIPILLLGVGVAFWYRRWHLMVHHPEKYERFHETEKKFAKVQVAATERTAKGLLAALLSAMRFIGSKLFRKKDRTPPVLGGQSWKS
jgi:hypothetical protein